MGGGHAHGVHAGGLRGLDADRGVLEDHGPRRPDARLGRRDEEDLRVGLAAGDVLQRRDRGEPADEPASSTVSSRFGRTPLEPIASSTPAAVKPSSSSRTPSIRAILPRATSR